MKKIESVWLENSGSRVLVDVGSRSEVHWRDLGYKEPGQEVAEKPVRKSRARKPLDT